MTSLKSFTIVAALLVGGTSLAMAQSGLPTGGYPPVAGGAAGNPATNPVSPGPPGPGMIPNDARGPAAQSTASSPRQATRQHRRIYMQGNTYR
jgi:hypothetical protein